MARVGRSIRTAAFALSACALLLSGGCKKDPPETSDDPSELAADGSTMHTTESDTEALTASLVGLDTAPLKLTLAGNFPTKGCFTATPDLAKSEITYQFQGCSGRFGLIEVTGTVVARTQSSPGKLVVNVTGNDLKMRGATVDWAATATVTGNGAARNMVWQASISGTTRSGKAFSRQTRKHLTWSVVEPCFAIDGSSEGEVGNRKVKIEIIGYRRCELSCPEPGSTIRVTNQTTGSEITLVHDADGATRTAKGKTTRFTPPCK